MTTPDARAHLLRLQAMVEAYDGDNDWLLSERDRDAIRWALEQIARAERQAESSAVLERATRGQLVEWVHEPDPRD